LETGVSLLNDALRKQDRETKRGKGVPLFETERKVRRKWRIIIYGIIIPFLLISFAGVFWVWQGFVRSDYFEDPKPSGIGPRVQYPENFSAARQVLQSDEATGESADKMNSAAVQNAGDDNAKRAPGISEPGVKPEQVEEKREASGHSAPAFPPPAPVVPTTAEVKTISTPDVPKPADDAVISIADPPLQTPNKGRNRWLKWKNQPVKHTGKGDDLEPSNNPFFLKAVNYHRQNRLRQAIAMYRAVLKKYPGHKDTHINISAAYIQSGAFSEANSILHGMMIREPEDPAILMNLAISEIGLKRPERAIFYLGQVRSNGDGETFDLCFHRGVAFSQLGDSEQAIKWYRKAEEINPEHPFVIYNMAVLYDKMGDYKSAIRYYQKRLAMTKFAEDADAISIRVNRISAYLANPSQQRVAHGRK